MRHVLRFIKNKRQKDKANKSSTWNRCGEREFGRWNVRIWSLLTLLQESGDIQNITVQGSLNVFDRHWG
jgi:hypothetical protein